MSRQVVTKTFTIPATDYAHPAKVIAAGAVVELSAAEITALNGVGGTVRATTARDALGESAGASNSS